MKNYRGYYSAMLRYCSGQSKLPYPNAPEPLGAVYGLDQHEADKIAREVHDAIEAAGGSSRPVCQPMRPCDVVRLRKAYTNRGLVAA
jgi:hypothetical protein